MFCYNFQFQKRENELEEILPELSAFAQILELNTDSEFITKQLLELGWLLDFGDEVGRRKLIPFVISYLQNTEISDQLCVSGMRLLRKMYSNDEEFIRSAAEIISEIQDPLEKTQGWNNQKNETKRTLRCLDIIHELLAKKKPVYIAKRVFPILNYTFSYKNTRGRTFVIMINNSKIWSWMQYETQTQKSEKKVFSVLVNFVFTILQQQKCICDY